MTGITSFLEVLQRRSIRRGFRNPDFKYEIGTSGRKCHSVFPSVWHDSLRIPELLRNAPAQLAAFLVSILLNPLPDPEPDPGYFANRVSLLEESAYPLNRFTTPAPSAAARRGLTSQPQTPDPLAPARVAAPRSGSARRLLFANGHVKLSTAHCDSAVAATPINERATPFCPRYSRSKMIRTPARPLES